MLHTDRMFRFISFVRENRKYDLSVLFFAPHGRTHSWALPVRRLLVCLLLLVVGCLWLFGSSYCVYQLVQRNAVLTQQLETSRNQLFNMQLRYENVIEKAYMMSIDLPRAVSASAIHGTGAAVGRQRFFAVVPLVQIGAPQGAVQDAPRRIALGARAERSGNYIKIDYSIRKMEEVSGQAKGYVWAYAVYTDGQKGAHYQVVPSRITFKPGSDEPEDFSVGFSFKVNRIKRGKMAIEVVAASDRKLEHVVVVAVDEIGRPLARESLSI